MKVDQDQFAPVTDATEAKDMQQLVSGLSGPSVLLAGMTEDQHQFQFNVRDIDGTKITFSPCPRSAAHS